MTHLLDLDSPEVRPCFEGVLPASLGSAATDGTPNVMWLSIVHRVDSTHVGLSRQFFNKTSRNIRENKRLQLLVIHPDNGRQFHIDLEHESTQTSGELFDRMRAHLDGIAAQGGMGRVFRLAGADVCRVVAITEVPSDHELHDAESRGAVELHAALKSYADAIAAATDVEELVNHALAALEDAFGFRHSMLLLVDETGERLFTVASRGYEASGAGSEAAFGDGGGHIGVAARRATSILSENLVKEHAYAHAVKESAVRAGRDAGMTPEIPLPGLAEPMSQLVVPVTALGKLLGVLCLQSEAPGFFVSAHENAMNVAASQLGMAMTLLRLSPTVDNTPWRIATPPADAPVTEVKHFASDDSILIDNEYLIRGVAGRILWRLLRQHEESERVEFSNKELRLDQAVGLPELNDNLEARLILLRRRLADRCPAIQIAKTGRGRFRLNVFRELRLVDSP